ncbi:MAG: hypothetical protein KBF76_00870 [Verrucomicrobiales bacterium]|nr:hypothetical protein [Verrucomicrobiales bacterium]
MNDVPPLLPVSASQKSELPTEKSGSGKKWAMGCGMGCLTLTVIGLIAGWMMFTVIKEKAGDMIGNFVSDQPVAIASAEVTPAQIDEATAKFEAFRKGMESDAVAVPLHLNAEELNALIFHHPSRQQFAGMGNISIENDQLKSQVSVNLDDFQIPVKFIADAVKGKYFNGDVTLSLGMAAGRPSLYIEELEVNGNAIPKEFLSELGGKNLLEEFQKDEKISAIFDKIEDIRIEDGELKIIPKGGAGSN